MYLGNSTVYSIGVDDRVLDGMERQLAALAEAIERAIERDHFPPRPSVLCKWCSFQQICPAFGDMQDDEPSAGHLPYLWLWLAEPRLAGY